MVFQGISGPAGICTILSLSNIYVKHNTLVIVCVYKLQFRQSRQEGEPEKSSLIFPTTTKKARKRWYGAALSLAEKLFWL